LLAYDDEAGGDCGNCLSSQGYGRLSLWSILSPTSLQASDRDGSANYVRPGATKGDACVVCPVNVSRHGSNIREENLYRNSLVLDLRFYLSFITSPWLSVKTTPSTQGTSPRIPAHRLYKLSCFSSTLRAIQILFPPRVNQYQMRSDIRTSELKSPVDIAHYLFTRLYQLGIRSIQGVPGRCSLTSIIITC